MHCTHSKAQHSTESVPSFRITSKNSTLHFLTPFCIAVGCYHDRWLKTYAVLLASLLIDLDHLLAEPIYDPTRCSIGFHPLHTIFPITLYVLALVHPKTRVLGIGLCVHVMLDVMDCFIAPGGLCL
jgi:hypothetical protein